jgi:hypothetical protein
MLQGVGIFPLSFALTILLEGVILNIINEVAQNPTEAEIFEVKHKGEAFT